MPVYEYQCSKCGARSEVMQKMSDPPLTVCNACGGDLKKLITNTSFVLKGGGWYVSDYPSSERKKAAEAEKPAAEKKEAATGSDAATKPDKGKETVNA